jgi:hypothetical protein
VTFFSNPISVSAKTFGLCDDAVRGSAQLIHSARQTAKPYDAAQPLKAAYIDELNSTTWIAVVLNSKPVPQALTFCALDKVLDLRKSDGSPDKVCDALLAHASTIIFVELKEREYRGWVIAGYEQLKSTISHFEAGNEARRFKTHKAYIANRLRPNAERGKMGIMEQFHKETGYTLRIRNTIEIE